VPSNSGALTTDRPSERPRTLRDALRSAHQFDLDELTVRGCLLDDKAPDELFARACRDGLDSLSLHQRRGQLATATGSIAEAVAQVILVELGYEVFFDVTRLGLHGVDLLMLAPDDSVIAFEVKGTLRAGSTPRMTRSALRQLTREWLNSADNLGMLEWSLDADDVWAGVIVLDFAASTWRAALSGDFEAFKPVGSVAQLSAPASHRG
jgi:hypothetical protein